LKPGAPIRLASGPDKSGKRQARCPPNAYSARKHGCRTTATRCVPRYAPDLTNNHATAARYACTAARYAGDLTDDPATAARYACDLTNNPATAARYARDLANNPATAAPYTCDLTDNPATGARASEDERERETKRLGTPEGR
jgi:hypothetical protein